MGPRSSHPLALALGLGFVACGPSGGAGSGSSSGTSGVLIGTSSSDGPGASESTIAGTTSTECAEVYVGDLWFSGHGPHDVSGLDEIGRVEGNLGIGSTDLEDLSFLGCVREVTGIVNIHSNENLVSLAGLERLELADKIWITSNLNLPSLDAVGPVKSLDELSLGGNLALTALGFDALETVERLRLGECGVDPSGLPPDYAPALTEIKGFGSLASITSLRVAGQTELVSLGRLHQIAEAGGLQYAGFYDNFKLPYAEIEQLEAEAGDDFNACGNLDDPEPLCWESDQFPSACTAPPP